MSILSKLPLEVSELEARIGYRFNNIRLLELAVTHSSYSNELKAKGVPCENNERLEFLGDAVLELVVSEFLYSNYREYPEGQLTKLRASVVCERALASYSLRIGLGDFIKLGNGEENNHGRENKSLLADAFEATLAAIFLDGKDDGKANVAEFVLPYVSEELKHLAAEGVGDYKSQLQQFIQQSGTSQVDYVLVGISGPEHRRTFTIEARLDSNVIGHGVGTRKGIAEQNAAHEALVLFGQLDGTTKDE